MFLNTKEREEVIFHTLPWLHVRQDVSVEALITRFAESEVHDTLSSEQKEVLLQAARDDWDKPTNAGAIQQLPAAMFMLSETVRYGGFWDRLEQNKSKLYPLRSWQVLAAAVVLAKTRELHAGDLKLFCPQWNAIHEYEITIIELEHGKVWLHQVPSRMEGANVRYDDAILLRAR